MSTLLTERRDRDLVAAGSMSQPEALIAARRPLLPPASQRRHYQGKSPALLREHVLIALRMFLIRLPFEDALIDELLKPGRQDVVRDPGRLEVLEPASTEQGVSHDEQCPPLSSRRARGRRGRACRRGLYAAFDAGYVSPLQDASGDHTPARGFVEIRPIVLRA